MKDIISNDIKCRKIKTIKYFKKVSIFKLSSSVTKYVQESKPAPVDSWDPPYCGELDIRIARDGQWYYNNSPIGRKRLVRLFSNILKREEDIYYLVTPAEKIKIKVDDVPFIIVDMEYTKKGTSQAISFLTNTETKFTLGKKNPLRVEFNEKTKEPSPYVTVRKNLEGLIDRKTFYRLADKCEIHLHRGESWFGIWSMEKFYPITESKNLELLD